VGIASPRGKKKKKKKKTLAKTVAKGTEKAGMEKNTARRGNTSLSGRGKERGVPVSRRGDSAGEIKPPKKGEKNRFI